MRNLSRRILLGDGVFQGLAGLEGRGTGGSNLHGFAGLGVAAGAGLTLLDLEDAEAADLHLVVLGKGGGDGAPNSALSVSGRLPQ